MGKQLHTRFTDDQIKFLLELYLKKAITLTQALQQLQCSKTQFFHILKKYRENSQAFTIAYARRNPHHRLPIEIDQVIRQELKTEYLLIKDPTNPLCQYNYAYLTDLIVKQLGQKISAQTVRNRAKEWGYYIPKTKKEKHPPRQVVTEAIGMLLQHDSSVHKWSPFAEKEWTLITTLDDHSRLLLYADFVETETTWSHIQALQSVVLKYGVGLCYYVDSHSIFRLVRHQHSLWQHQRVKTDEVPTQWRLVLEKCGFQIIYALSPEAKGKVERPYRWLQDRIVRRCARERITKITDGRGILGEEMKRYNEHQVHSTTGEIPALRFARAIRERRNCFKPFQLAPPYTSIKDIFCLHDYRKIDGYNRIMWQREKIKVPGLLTQGTEIELHIVPQVERTEVRLWYKGRVLKVIYYKS
jgi:hypothetical protein